MLRIQSFFQRRLAICAAHRAPGARAGPRRVLAVVLFAVLLVFAGASAAPGPRAGAAGRQQRPEQQEGLSGQGRQERVSDWATDNLDLVSASPTQIRDVLAKNPGLMVELKRLMAKQAVERGQIVAEQDLEDDAILSRLATDTRFRALATRLLQRYGYLTPQPNPLSPLAKEQDLLLRVKAERLARLATTDADWRPELGLPQEACGQDQDNDNPACRKEASKPPTDLRAGIGDFRCPVHTRR